MQTPTRMDKAVNKYPRHMTIMNENVNRMKLTNPSSRFSLNSKGSPLAHLPLLQHIQQPFWIDVHTRKQTKKTSPLCIPCMLMPQI
jgi:hypothetical protein